MPNPVSLKRNIEKMESLKEILLTMPKNNEKNIEKYVEKVQELIATYTKSATVVEKEIIRRYEKYVNIIVNPEIANIENRLNTIDSAIYVLKSSETSFEKMELDKYIYKISRFYKDNLENINNQIALCIEAFKKTGIVLTAEDFDYTTHAKEYMTVFFEEMKNGNVNSDVLKRKFEDIYWRCSDIIIHIELNLRNLYLINEANIDRYFNKQAMDLLTRWQKAPKDIRNGYLELKRSKLELIETDRKLILDEFLVNNLKVNDYTPEKVHDSLEQIIQKETLDRYQNNEEKLLSNVKKFYNSLVEYKNYLNFKYIIDDIKRYYQDRENYKKVYDETRKQIDDKEKKLKKINKKLTGTGLFGGKKDITKQSAEQNELITELKNLYKQLDLNKVYNKIYTEFSNESTVYDVLNLAASYYIYLTDVMIKNNKNITQEEIDEQVNKLDEFLTNPYNTVINHLTILDEKDVVLIIKDRYKLLDFIVERQDLSTNNIDELMETLKRIMLGLNMKRTDVHAEDVENIFEIKKLLKLK